MCSGHILSTSDNVVYLATEKLEYIWITEKKAAMCKVSVLFKDRISLTNNA